MATMAELMNNPLLYAGLGLMSAGARRPANQPGNTGAELMNALGMWQQQQQAQQAMAQRQQQEQRLQQQFEMERAAQLEAQGRAKTAEEQMLAQREAIQSYMRDNPNAAPGDITRSLMQMTGDPELLKYMSGSNAQQRTLMLNAGNGGVAVLPPGATEPTFYQSPDGAGGQKPQIREFKTGKGVSTRQMGPDGKWQEVEFAPYGARESGAAAAKQELTVIDPKLRESEAKATTFYSQMVGARGALEGLYTNGFNPESPVGQAEIMAAGNPATNFISSAPAQQARQAQEQWAEAYLRFKTGAATNLDEIRRNVRTFFPQLGDKAATIKQKAEARLRAEKDIALSAGKGAGMVEGRSLQDTGVQPITRPDAPAAAAPDEWVERALRANPGMSREQVIEEGRRRGKLR